MLNALTIVRQGARRGSAGRAAAAMRRQGFEPAFGHAWRGAWLQAWSHPRAEGDDAVVRADDAMACCVGPLWYRGHFGPAGLRVLLDEYRNSSRFDEHELRGNFVVYVQVGDRAVVFNDLSGLVRLYLADHVASTSWLAACAVVGPVALDADAAIEYVLLGASHAARTPACGVTLLPAAYRLDLVNGQLQHRFDASFWSGADVPSSPAQAHERLHGALQRGAREVATAFPGKVRMALSGGFDSRLLLAMQHAQGQRPDLFVYGTPASADVRLAQAVAAAGSLDLEVIDKRMQARGLPAPDLARLRDNALFFDGLPNDGILDSGVDVRTRQAQTRGGHIVLNGGGGEIFRNFFHLPDRAYRATDVVNAFYRGFDAGVFRARGGLDRYMRGLAASMLQVLGMDAVDPDPMLARQQVELLYPLFRCHYWMGANNSVSVRHGMYATPLLDIDTVRFAAATPLAWKQAGRLQSVLIDRFDHVLAAQPSGYGFRFSDGPHWRARFSAWRTGMRPVAWRPAINAVRRRWQGGPDMAGLVDAWRARLPGMWQLDPVLDPARLPDRSALSRALAIEVVWRELVG